MPSSAAVDGSTSGAAALISTSSSWIRAWAPLAVASSARRDEVEQAHRVGLGQRLACSASRAVALGRDPQLARDLAEHLDGQQLAAVDLEVAQHLAGVAARLAPARAAARSAARDRAATIASTASNSCSASATPSTASTSAGAIGSSPA